MASDSSGSGGPPRGGSLPSSLGTPETEELLCFGLMVPPGCRLPHEFHITADGYPTRGPGATPEELRLHHGGRWNAAGRHRFWDGKDYWTVIGELRRATGGSSSAPRPSRRRTPALPPPPRPSCSPAPAPAGPLVPPAVEIPAELAALREEGDPDDSPGYLVALRASRAEAAAAAAREAADLQAALDAAAAMAAAEAPAVEAAAEAPVMEEDDRIDWDAAVQSSDDDAGNGGAGEVLNLADSNDE